MLPKTRRRIQRIENTVGIDGDFNPWSMEGRLRKLEEQMRLLAGHLDVEFSYVPQHPIIKKRDNA
jgi:hypothetical protein